MPPVIVNSMKFFCNAPLQRPSVEFEICAHFGVDSDLGLDLDVYSHPDMVVQQLGPFLNLN
jgi:hypothetical protein